jgi:hypothetical protein
MTTHPFLITLVAITASACAASAENAGEAWALETPTGTLHGSLLLPSAQGRRPVIFIHPGSGPTDRNGNIAAIGGRNDSLLQLAEELALRGLASLRVDKRGIAESRPAGAVESELRFDTYVGDVVAWASRLRNDARFGPVILAGHSEGAQIVALAAVEVKPEGVVLLSGLGQPAPQIIRRQLEGRLPPDLVQKFEAILSGLEQGKMTDDVPAPLSALFRPSVQPYLISWFRHSPAVGIAAVPCPVLIIQGDADLQVTTEDARLLAAAQAKAQLLVLDGVNHVLKPVTGDMAAQLPSYRSPEPRVDPRVAEAMAQFVAKECSLPSDAAGRRPSL